MKVFGALLSAVLLAMSLGDAADAKKHSPARGAAHAAHVRADQRFQGVVMKAPKALPKGWRSKGRAKSNEAYNFTVHLKSADMDALTKRMVETAVHLPEPLTLEELKKYTAAPKANVDAVRSHLTAAGIPASAIKMSATGDQMSVRATVGQTAKVFSASFDDFAVDGHVVARAQNYTIPGAIAQYVDIVSPLTSFVYVPSVVKVVDSSPLPERILQSAEHNTTDGAGGMVVRPRSGSATPAACNTQSVTPNCLRALYGTASYVPAPNANQNDVFVAGFIDQYYNDIDLKAFLLQNRIDAFFANVPVINVAGATNNANPAAAGIEAMLDVETVVSQTHPLRSTFYNFGTSNSPGDIFAQAFDDLVNNRAKSLPGVYTISYGAVESDLTPDQARAMCKSAQKLSALGTTIIVSSGDNGVGGQNGATCPAFVPTYPSGCPYITSVGATQNFNPEVAVSPNLAGFYSGSGFSNIFARTEASFQQSAVTSYLNKIGNTPAKSLYNTNGRAFPDVSAQGSLYTITANLRNQRVSGTSASAPTFASIVALLNDARRKAGKGRLGWINPFLYANQAAFNDVVSGSALGCTGQPSSGFAASAGYDLVGGLGTPIFDKLRTAALK